MFKLQGSPHPSIRLSVSDGAVKKQGEEADSMTPDPYIDPFLPGRECMTQEKQGWVQREAAAGNTCGKINHNGSLWFLSLVPTYTKKISWVVSNYMLEPSVLKGRLANLV